VRAEHCDEPPLAVAYDGIVTRAHALDADCNITGGRQQVTQPDGRVQEMTREGDANRCGAAIYGTVSGMSVTRT
jgi:hypothetical protein